MSFSASVVVGDSPVVPDITKPSHPASTRWFASRTAAGISREPSGANGVTIAVSSVPKGAWTSNPPVLTNPDYLAAPTLFGSATRLAQASVASGLVATSVPSASVAIWKSLNTAAATSTSWRRHAMASRRISTSACSLARTAMKCRQAR